MTFSTPEDRPKDAARRESRLRRVVVIDDSELDADLLEMRLQAHFPALESVLRLSSPENLLQRIADHRPDLVITDYHMPGYDVVDHVAALRQRWPLLPVLVMSGLVGEEQAIAVLKAGANDFLPKSRSERLPIVIARELAEADAQFAWERLQEQLERQRRINQAIVEQVPVGLWLLSPDGEVVRANRRGADMLGSPALHDSGFQGLRGWWSDSGAPIRAQDWPGARAVSRRETVAPRLMRVKPQHGLERHFSCAAAPLLAEDGSMLGAVMTAVDMTDEVALQEQLRRAEAQMRHLSANQLELHEREMAGVSRELHDNLGQVLSLLKLHLGSAAHPDTPAARRALELSEAVPLVDLALRRLREVCGELWPSELSAFGLGPALVALCSAAARAGGIVVQAQEHGEPRPLDARLALGLFRVGQQAVTNALRHSGAATVQLALHWSAQAVDLSVADDGAGFNPQAERRPDQQGLRSMRERMELLGGTLLIESQLGEGTVVRARVPATAQENL
jgi:two-component system sensor histidine kinase UhpB